MTKKYLIPMLFIVLSLFGNCNQQEYATFKKPIYNSVLEAPPAEMEAVVDQTYRLRPDRRFELAIQELRSIFSLEGQTLEYFFKDGAWHVFADRMKVCVLDEFPSFQQLLDVLTGLATRYNNKYPLALGKDGNPPALRDFKRKPEDFYPLYLSEFLDELDQRWKMNDRHPVYMKWATEAYTILGLQSFDYLQLADRLHARTLAFLAMSKALTSHHMNRCEMILSHQMGYEGHCRRLLEQSSISGPFPLFFLRKDRELEAMALKDGDFLARYLWLLRFAERKEVEGWERLRRRLFDESGKSLLPAIKTGLALNRFNLNRTLSRSLPAVVLDHIGLDVKNPAELDLVTAAQMFEQEIARWSGKDKGFFSSSSAMSSFYRGFFYSALYKLGIHLLDELASVQSGMFYLEELGEDGAPMLAELKDWYSLLLKFRRQRSDIKLMLDRLRAPGSLGGRLLQRFSSEAGSMIPLRSPKLLEMVRLLVKKMDTRMSNRYLFARLSLQYLNDLDLLERILVGSKKADCVLSLWHAVYSQNKTELLQILRLPFPPLRIKVRAIREIAGFRETRPLFVQYEFNKLMEKYPDDWDVVKEYAGYLKNSAKFRQAGEVVAAWLGRHDSSRGFDYINARKELARLYYLDENYEKGLEAIEEVATSWQAGVLETKALLLSRLGKRSQAEELARKVVKRYPSSIRSRAVMAEICWRHGKFQAACDVLKNYPRSYVSLDWTDHIGLSFLRGFEGQTLDKAVEAFRMLVNSNFSPVFLQAIPFKCHRAGKSRWAFHLQSDLKLTGISHLNLLVTAYRYGKEFMDEGEALKWLKRNTPDYLHPPLSMVAFSLQEYELPWEWERSIKSKQRIAYDWLMKAACALMSGGEEHPRWKELTAYYSKEGISHYHQLGRHLTGLASKEELFEYMDMPGRKCEIAFFIGLKKEAEGDLYGAGQWYRICLETGLEKNLEYIWAHERLNNWAQNNLFLRLIH